MLNFYSRSILDFSNLKGLFGKDLQDAILDFIFIKLKPKIKLKQ